MRILWQRWLMRPQAKECQQLPEIKETKEKSQATQSATLHDICYSDINF